MGKSILSAKALVIIALMFTNFINSQSVDFYYTFNNNKIYLYKQPTNYLLDFNSENEAITTLQSINTPKVKLDSKTYFVSDLDESNITRNYIKYPAYLTQDGKSMYYKNDIVLKFKSTVDASQINSLVSSNNLFY